MKVAIFQPPYPHEGTAQAALDCMNWMKSQLKTLIGKNIDLIILPEYANCPGIEKVDILMQFISREGRKFSEVLQHYALALNCPILSGIAEKTKINELKNRVVFFSPSGEAIYKYDKTHLTQAELDWDVVPGSKIGVFEWNGLKLGFVVCFDIYFPEYISALTAAEVDIIINPSYQRGENTDTIEAMTSVRALDSGTWILRSSYSIAPDSPIGGYSMLVDSSGKILANAESMPGVLIEDFDPNEKYSKPASYGKSKIESRVLLKNKRRPEIYRKAYKIKGKKQVMQKKKILFICTGNAGRSQMAEAMFHNQYGDKFEIVSAGVEPWDDLHPMAVKLMNEDGLDMTGHYPQHVKEYINDKIDIAVTIGDRAEAESGSCRKETIRIHWPINDPADADGTSDSEKLFRWTRQAIIDRFPKLLEIAES